MTTIPKPSSQSETEKRDYSLQDLIKRAAEAVTVSIALCYLAGFLIVNTYLLGFGYAGSSLFKVKYISAGSLFLLITAILAISVYPVLWGHKAARKFDAPPSETTWHSQLWGSGIAIYAIYQVLSNVGGQEVRLSEGSKPPWLQGTILAAFIVLILLQTEMGKWKGVPWLKKYPGLSYVILVASLLLTSIKMEALAFLLPLVIVVWRVMDAVIEKERLKERFKTWPLSPTYDLVLTFVFALSAIGIFATNFYGYAKPQFGGGQPANVKLIISDSKKNQLRHLGDPARVQALLSSAWLIDTSEHEYLILVKSEDSGEKLLQLDRSMVDAILYLQ